MCFVGSGESAFHAMMSGFGWAKNPMLNRMHDVRDDKHITLLYGSRSWIDKSSWDLVKASRPSSYVNVQVSARQLNPYNYQENKQKKERTASIFCQLKFLL